MDFCLLPTEILEKILSFLDIRDIINIRKINERLSEISGSRGVINKVKLFGCYELDTNVLINFLTKWPTCNNITTLNVTSVYWIGASDLRKCILTMDNLQRLFVIDTKMGLTKSDVQLYCNLPKLRRLAVTITPRNFTKGAYKNLPPLTHVYIHVHTTMLRQLHGILPVIDSPKILQALWIVEIGVGGILQPISIKLPVNVPRVVISSVSFSCHRDTLKAGNFAKVYMSSVSDQQFSFKKSLEFKLPKLCKRKILDPHWNYIIKFLSRDRSIFSPKEHEEIYFDDRKLNTLVFNEINLDHNDTHCSKSFLGHCKCLLEYPNFQKIKKIGLSYCACVCDESTNVAPQSASLLEKIADNSPDLQELELWKCSRIDEAITKVVLENIARFQNLRRLILDDLPVSVSEKFLTKILHECKNLKSLHIKSMCENRHIKLLNLLINALHGACNIKDLRFEQKGQIYIDNFFEAMGRKDMLKLERLCIICDSVESFSVKLFERFLYMNPQLVFLYIQVYMLPLTFVYDMNVLLEKWRTDPKKIYYITSINDESIPDVHLLEMVRTASKTSVINVFTDFIS